MLYKLKSDTIDAFISHNTLNKKIVAALEDTHFELIPARNGDGFEAVMAGSTTRICIHGLFDFTPDEVEKYLEVVDSPDTPSEITLTELHDWAIAHGMTNLPVSKVVEIHKIYVR